MDWARGDITHELAVQFVDAPTLSASRGYMEGVTDGSLKLDYYGDTRMSATLSSVDTGESGWDGVSAFRLIHTARVWNEEPYTETLGTFFADPQDPVDWSVAGESYVRSWKLDGTIYGLKVSAASGGFTAGAGAKVRNCIDSWLRNTPCHWRFGANFRNYTFGSTKVYDRCVKYTDMLFDLCDLSGNRMSVDPDGYVTFDLYTAPRYKAPEYSIDANDPRTILIGPVKYADSGLDVPSRTLVHAKDGDTEIVGGANSTQGTRYAAGNRGYRYDNVIQENDITPFSTAQAEALARKYQREAEDVVQSASFQLMYVPLREGDVIELTHDGETRRWQIASATLDLSSWVWSIDAKGGWQ